MKLRRFLFAFLLALAAFQFCFSQEKNENLILFASSLKITYEEIAAQTDYFVNEIYKTPNAVGYIVIYGGANPIENAFYKNAIIRNTKFRKFSEEKLKIITSTTEKEIKLEFWISKDGTPPAVEKDNNSLILPATNKALYFAGDLINLSEIDGKQTYYFVGCEAGCIEFPDFYLLSEILKANPQLKAFVIIHNKNFKKAEIVKDAIKKNARVLPNRINFIYGGKNKINDKQFSEIEVYLASDESQLPKLSLIKYKHL